MKINIRVADWDHEGKTLSDIRRTVFIQEQSVPEALEWDEYDQSKRADVIHLLAENDDGYALGCVRILSSGKITRMAVLANYREQGVGSHLLRAATEHIEKNPFEPAYLDAQISAVPFYTAHGFLAEGGIFMDAGIEHVRMQKISKRPQKKQNVFDTPALACSYIQTFSLATSRTLDIFTQTLDPLLFQDKNAVEAISYVARRSRQSRIRILVKNPRPLYGKDVPLIRLTQRLPTHMAIRAYTEGAKQEDQSYLCFDDQHWIHLAEEDNAVGSAHWQERAQTQSRLEEFEHLWQTGSKEDANFKRLSI